MTTDSVFILDRFIKNFVPIDKRERVQTQLKDPKKRGKFTDKLNHEWGKILDMKFLAKIPSGVDDNDYIRKESKIKGTELCYIISNYSEIDDKILPFDQAFNAVYGRGLGSLIINSTSNKLYLETEIVQGKQNRFLGKK